MRQSGGDGRARRFVRGLVGAAEMPPEIMLDVSKVTLVGAMQVHIENHRGIASFTSEGIIVRTRGGFVHIRGHRLRIDQLLRDEVVVEGRIEVVDLRPPPVPEGAGR